MAATGPVTVSIVTTSIANGTTGAVTVPVGGTETLVAKILCSGIDKMLLVGTVSGVGPLTDLRIATSAAGTVAADSTIGQPATELSGSGGDFATPAGILERATTSPHTTATGNSFRIGLSLNGEVYALWVYAKSTSGAALTIDVSGVNVQ